MSNILVNKSEENRKIAEIAENESLYNVAVSRNYYRLFLLIVNFVSARNPSYKAPTGVGSHQSTLSEFCNCVGLPPRDLRHFNTSLVNLTTLRNKYEYSSTEYLSDSKDYNRVFKRQYEDICARIRSKQPTFFS